MDQKGVRRRETTDKLFDRDFSFFYKNKAISTLPILYLPEKHPGPFLALFLFPLLFSSRPTADYTTRLFLFDDFLLTLDAILL